MARLFVPQNNVVKSFANKLEIGSNNNYRAAGMVKTMIVPITKASSARVKLTIEKEFVVSPLDTRNDVGLQMANLTS